MNARFLRRLRESAPYYLFLLIPLIYIIVFAYVPMAGVQIAFRKYGPRTGIWGSPWVGLRYFEKFFSSYKFFDILKNTLSLSVYQMAAGFPIPIVFALLLNVMRNERYKKVIQTITYMPHFISIVVLVGMVNRMLSPINGIYALLINTFGIPRVDILANPDAFSHIYVWSGVWQAFGWNSIVYLAALTAVSPELHEAAEIDGASRWQRVLHVDLPAILPTATIMLILRFGQIMSVGFEKVYLLQNDMNLRTSEIISTYVYKIGIGSGGLSDYSYATAIGLFNSVINLILVTSVNAIARKMGETSLW